MLVRFILRREHSGAGYQANVRIDRSGTPGHESEGFLPAVPASLDEAFRQWRDSYFTSGVGSTARFRDLSIQSSSEADETVSRISPGSTSTGGNPTEHARRLRQELNAWLNAPSGTWLNVRDHLVRNAGIRANNSEGIRVLLQFDDPRLRRLPWRSWEVFQDNYSGAEIAFITPGASQPLVQKCDSVRIIVVVGNSRGIETGTQADVETIERLRDVGAKVTILRQPEPNELIKALREQPYEIFIFTGHSRSEQDGIVGRLELNESQNLAFASITVDQLRENLGEAVKKGLQLCVFNSCDGLGLSQQFLRELGLPIAIVMREPVPDGVAVKFLRDFFEHFAFHGHSLFAAFQEARLGLEEFAQFPGITWLPAICISSLTEPPTWQHLSATTPISKPPVRPDVPLLDGKIELENKSSSDKWKRWSFLAVALVAVVGLLAYCTTHSREQANNPNLPTSSPSPTHTASAVNYPALIKDINPSPPNGSWRYGGSRSMVPLQEKVKEPIRQAFSDKFHLEDYQAIGTKRGRNLLLEGKLDFILASEKDDTSGFEYKPIAKDAIAVAINPDLQLPRGLTLDQLKGIYTGQFKNWKDVDGPDLPIKAFYRSLAQSGTSEDFMKQLKIARFDQTLISLDKGPTEMAQTVKNTKGAIYFGTASEVLGQCSVKPIPIGSTANDFVLPYKGGAVVDPQCPNKRQEQINLDAINQGQYPLIREVFVVFPNDNSDAKKAGEAYANMLLTNEGQELIKSAGFAPLRSSH